MRYYRPVVRAFLLTSAILLGGCSSCDGAGPAVPFGLEAGTGESPESPRGTPAAPRALEVRTFPEGTPRIDVEGGAVAVEGSIRGLLAHDLDGDGDRDALVVASGPARLLFFRREGATFESPRELGRAEAPADCTVSEATLTALGDHWVLAHASIGCEESAADARVERWIVDIDRTPRALEHLALLAPTGRAEGEVGLEFTVDDRDEDGRDDLTVEVTVTRASATSLTLTWLDRPNGLVRDPSEPENTLEERSRDALRRLRTSPAEALGRSRSVLALHEVLCREPGRARIRLGRSEGIPCGDSNGAGRAATTVVRAHAAMGEMLEALDGLALMQTPGLLINDERRRYARRAIAESPAQSNVSLREGPSHPSGGSGVRLSALGFLDEDRVLLRSTAPRIWDLRTDETLPTDATRADRRVLDPSGRFAVAAVQRSCEGQVLRIVRTTSAGIHSSPLLVERTPPPGATCPGRLDEADAQDDGGWTVLGWAPQGLLASRRGELRVVPLDVSALPAGPAETLTPGTPPPAPLPPGAISADGRHHVELRGPGVVVHRVAEGAEPQLLWPQGWGERDGDVTDAAVSPSGRRVAVLRGGRVYLFERSSTSSPSGAN